MKNQLVTQLCSEDFSGDELGNHEEPWKCCSIHRQKLWRLSVFTWAGRYNL